MAVRICQVCAARFGGSDWRCAACGWSAARVEGVFRVAPDSTADVHYDAENFAQLAAIEDSHFWFVSRNALIAWALARYFPGARTFLEVGCGGGQVVAALRRAAPHLRITACEAFMAALRIAAARAPDVELVEADARALPFEDEFDVAGAFDVIEHIPDDGRAVRELARAVKPGGGVLITVPQHRFLWSSLDAYAGHQRRYSRARLIEVLHDGGLEVVRTTSFVSLLLPAMLVSRLRRGGVEEGLGGEFRLSRGANRIGRVVMTLERALIRGGIPLPAGGSLLAIARRRA